MEKEEIFLTIGNMDLKITKEGKIQVRVSHGTATVEKGFKVTRGKESVALPTPLTTTSTSWVDVTGLSLGKKEKHALEKLKTFFSNNRSDWYQLASLILQLLKP